MAISLAAIEVPGFWAKAAVLGAVAMFVTVGVYGVVALIVKADDAGVWLARDGKLAATRALGRGLVGAMPGFLRILSVVGTAAMLWVGGGIVLHGAEAYGLGAVPHAIQDFARSVGSVFGPLGGFMAWLVDATIAGMFGLGLGWLVERIVHRIDHRAAHAVARRRHDEGVASGLPR